jgi:uncharacterized protein YbjQ (UPF0145 family)
MRAQTTAFTLLALCVAGCSSFVPVTKLDALPQSERARMADVAIYNAAQLNGLQFKVVNMVEGHSCKHMMWDPAPTNTAAVDQLKHAAAKMGANGVTNVQCGGRERTSLHTNCWELISCTAEAISVDD